MEEDLEFRFSAWSGKTLLPGDHAKIQSFPTEQREEKMLAQTSNFIQQMSHATKVCLFVFSFQHDLSSNLMKCFEIIKANFFF